MSLPEIGNSGQIEPHPATQRCQVLALSGGGYRGLFTAKLLAHAETHYGTQCSDRFDLIAGTSIGALLAAGLACGISAKDLAVKFSEHGEKIFPKSKLKNAARLTVRAPYDREPVETAIIDTLGKAAASTPLRELAPPLLIVAVNYTTGEPVLFTSGGLDQKSASDATLIDAITASAAAPSFFPVKKIGTDDFIDGGLIANAPDMVAYLHARRRLFADPENIYMLSVGTASRREGAALKPDEMRPGGVVWVKSKRLIQSIMTGQESLALQQAGLILGDRHLRLDEEPASEQQQAIADLDQADAAATATLTSLADKCWAVARQDARLRDFFRD